jgi:amidase
LVAPLATRRKDEQFWIRLSHLTAYCFGEDKIRIDPVGYSHAEWLAMDNARHMVRRAWEEFFKDFDLFLCPAAAYTAQLHDAKRHWHQMQLQVAGRPLSVVDATFWGAMATLAHLPATVAPAGVTPAGLPVGVQIMGPEYGDNTCLAIAQFLERFQGFASPPAWD